MSKNLPTIFGISGRALSGKDTVGQYLQAKLGGSIYHFADPIRAMLAVIGIDMNHPYWREHKEVTIPGLGKSPRQLMQTLGTEWGRECVNEDLWTMLAHSLVGSEQLPTPVMIPDVRFENEADWIRDSKGIILHVVRDVVKVSAHISEYPISVDPRDVVVHNNGTVQDLHKALDELLSDYPLVGVPGVRFVS